jgi:hypothetical protein
MKTVIFAAAFILTLKASASPQFDQHLQCEIASLEDPAANPPAKLEAFIDLQDGLKSTFNGANPQGASRPELSHALGVAQIVELNDQQLTVTSDFKNIWVKDVASYNCALIP